MQLNRKVKEIEGIKLFSVGVIGPTGEFKPLPLKYKTLSESNVGSDFYVIQSHLVEDRDKPVLHYLKRMSKIIVTKEQRLNDEGKLESDITRFNFTLPLTSEDIELLQRTFEMMYDMEKTPYINAVKFYVCQEIISDGEVVGMRDIKPSELGICEIDIIHLKPGVEVNIDLDLSLHDIEYEEEIK